MQMPIKENIQFKTVDTKLAHNVSGSGSICNTLSTGISGTKLGSITAKEVNALGDTSNPIISQVILINIIITFTLNINYYY